MSRECDGGKHGLQEMIFRQINISIGNLWPLPHAIYKNKYKLGLGV
jgi:hypothetical protein